MVVFNLLIEIKILTYKLYYNQLNVESNQENKYLSGFNWSKVLVVTGKYANTWSFIYCDKNCAQKIFSLRIHVWILIY